MRTLLNSLRARRLWRPKSESPLRSGRLRDIAAVALGADQLRFGNREGHHVAFPTDDVVRNSGLSVVASGNAEAAASLQSLFDATAYVSDPVVFARLKGVFVDGMRGVCVTRDGCMIEETAHVARIIDPALSHVPFVSRDQQRFISGRCPVVSQPVLHCFHGSMAYGHFTFDMLPVIAWWRQDILQGKLKLLLPPLPDWVIRHLAAIGIEPEHCVPRNHPALYCEDLVVASAFDTSNTFRPQRTFARLAGPALGCLDPTQWGNHKEGRRIYLSRRNQHNYFQRNVSNEDAVRALLIGIGFEVLEPANLSLREQAAAFKDASVIAGPHGSGFGNIMFARPGTAIVDLMPADWMGYWGDTGYAERWLLNATTAFQLDYTVLLNASALIRTLPADDQSGLQTQGMVATVDIGDLRRVVENVLDT